MANNDLIQRAELLNRIQELTTRIIQSAGSLNLSATQASNFAKSLDLIKQKAQETKAELNELNMTVERLADRMNQARTGIAGRPYNPAFDFQDSPQLRLPAPRENTPRLDIGTSTYQAQARVQATVIPMPFRNSPVTSAPVIHPLPVISPLPTVPRATVIPVAPSIPLPGIGTPPVIGRSSTFSEQQFQQKLDFLQQAFNTFIQRVTSTLQQNERMSSRFGGIDSREVIVTNPDLNFSPAGNYPHWQTPVSQRLLPAGSAYPQLPSGQTPLQPSVIPMKATSQSTDKILRDSNVTLIPNDEWDARLREMEEFQRRWEGTPSQTPPPRTGPTGLGTRWTAQGWAQGTVEIPGEPRKRWEYTDDEWVNFQNEVQGIDRERARQRAREAEARARAGGGSGGYTPPAGSGGYGGAGGGGTPPPTGYNDADFWDWMRNPDRKGRVQYDEPIGPRPQPTPEPTIQYDNPIGPRQAPAWYYESLRKAKQYGFSENDIRGVQTEASTGNSRVQFQNIDEVTGAFKTLNLTVSKSGEVLVDTQRRFRSFFSAVGRDTLEFLKWSMAVSLVLGPLQKFNELIGIAINNESKLADVSIALSGGQEDINKVFAASADIANAAGEELTTVIDAYTAAYRAIGSGVEPTERLTKANKLLSDSLILSKLSGLNEVESIDTLSAALKQSQKAFGDNIDPLTQGTTLLDKWIRTTQVANVDLETLATGFAIVGDAAESAGMQLDDINGLLATIAETGVASGKEVANAARAMISGFQSDQSKKLLNSFGIATEIEGQMRPFQDILNQIAELRKTGIISEANFNKLTLTLGGGSRRQAVWSTLIQNSDRIGTVANESRNAGGEAMDALAKKTDTVQTATVRLSNAFQVLAETLGTKGGILDDFKLMVNMATGLVKIFDTLSGAVGKAFPVAIAGIGMGMYLAGKSQDRQAQFSPGGILAGLTTRQGNLTNDEFEQLKRFRTTGFNASGWTKVGTGLATAALPVISNLADDSLSSGQKAFKVGADIVGGIVGSLGGPAGAVIGVTIAEAFSSAVISTMNKDYSGTYAEIAAKITGKPLDSEKKPLTRGQQLVQEAEKRLNISGNLGVNTEALIQRVNDKYDKKKLAEMPQGEILDLLIKEAPDKFTKDSFEQLKKAMEIRANEIQQETGKLPKETVDKFISENTQDISGVQNKLSTELFTGYSSGSVGKAGLTKGLENVKGLPILGTQWYKTIGQGQSVQEFFNKAGTISAYSSPEDIQSINEYVEKLNQLKITSGDMTKTDKQRQDALDEYNRTLGVTLSLMERLYTESLASKPTTPVVDMFGLSEEDYKKVYKQATEVTAPNYYKGQKEAGMTDEEIKARQSLAAPFLAQLGETNYKSIGKGKVEQDLFEQALQELIDLGTIEKPGKVKDTPFQAFDMTSGKFQEYMSKYPEMEAQLIKAGYKPDRTTEIAVFNDGVIKPMKMDWKIVQYLLQQIADNTKELTGEFNLPDGMTFNIPSSAAELWKKSMGKGNFEGTGTPTATPGATSGPVVPKVEGINKAYQETLGETRSQLSRQARGMGDEDPYSKPRATLETERLLGIDRNPDWLGTNRKDSAIGQVPFVSASNPPLYQQMDYFHNQGFGDKDMPQSSSANISSVVDKLTILNNNLTTFAERPINLNLTTTSVLMLDGRQITESVSRYMGLKLSAMGGAMALGRNSVGGLS